MKLALFITVVLLLVSLVFAEFPLRKQRNGRRAKSQDLKKYEMKHRHNPQRSLSSHARKKPVRSESEVIESDTRLVEPVQQVIVPDSGVDMTNGVGVGVSPRRDEENAEVAAEPIQRVVVPEGSGVGMNNEVENAGAIVVAEQRQQPETRLRTFCQEACETIGDDSGCILCGGGWDTSNNLSICGNVLYLVAQGCFRLAGCLAVSPCIGIHALTRGIKKLRRDRALKNMVAKK